MKNHLKTANKLVSEINKLYNQLTIENERFFETYHDDLRIQSDCSFELLGEIEYYEEKGETKFVGPLIEDLRQTLTYCKAVIDLQTQTNNLPKSIFG
jgi:hypothetical protein